MLAVIHPPFSPELAKNDFFLFSNVKNKLHERFSSEKEPVYSFKSDVLEVPQAVWKIRDLNYVVRKGEYFGKFFFTLLGLKYK